MKDLVVTANVPEKKKDGKVVQKAIGPFTITVKTGESCEEKIKMFGDIAVSSNADANWVVTLQGTMRSAMKKGESQPQMQARLGGSKMGVASSKVQIDPKQAWLAQYQAANPEERKRMKKELLAQAESIG